jgi:hypothetical protein
MVLTIDEVQSEARSMEGNSGWKMKTQLQSGNDFEGIILIVRLFFLYYLLRNDCKPAINLHTTIYTKLIKCFAYA